MVALEQIVLLEQQTLAVAVVVVTLLRPCKHLLQVVRA